MSTYTGNYDLKTEELTVCLESISDALKIVSAHQKKIQDKHERKQSDSGYTSKTITQLEAIYHVKCMEIKTKLKHMDGLLLNAPVSSLSGRTSQSTHIQTCYCDTSQRLCNDLLGEQEKQRYNIKDLHVRYESLKEYYDEEIQRVKQKHDNIEEYERLSAVASNTDCDNNPNITDLSDVNRPTKIAEKMSELYENEWTDAFDSLKKSHPDMDVVKTLLNVLKNINDQCQNMAWQDFFEQVQSAIELPRNIPQEFKPKWSEYKVALTKEMQQQIKAFWILRAQNVFNVLKRTLVPSDLECDDLTAYYDMCVEVCWLAAVQDPPLSMNFNAGEKFDTSHFKEYSTTLGPYVEFLVWPALHLHKDGPLLSKGVVQGTTIRPQQREDSTQQMSQDSVGGKRIMAPQSSVHGLNNQLANMSIYTANPTKRGRQNQHDFVSSMMLTPPFSGQQSNDCYTGTPSGEVYPSTTVSTTDSSWEDTMWRNKLEAAKAERDKNIALLNSSQDQIASLEKENNGLREENAKLQKRLLELQNDTRYVQSENASLRRLYQQEKAEKDDALTRLNAVAKSKIRDNNPNIADLSDVNRPTKIAEKISELYDNEWTDAFDSLEKSHPDINVVKTLLDNLKNVFDQCQKMAWQDFFEQVQCAIELPGHIPQEFKPKWSEYKVALTKEMQQQIKEFRKLRAPNVLNILKNTLVPKDLESDDLTAYYNKCVEVCWFAVVHDPPLFMNFNAGEKFDTSLFKDYTARGPYVEFLVWPALHLHKDGPLLSKGVAQGTTTRPTHGVKRQTSHDSSVRKRSKTPPSPVQPLNSDC